MAAEQRRRVMPKFVVLLLDRLAVGEGAGSLAALRRRGTQLAIAWEIDPRRFIMIYVASMPPYYAGAALVVAGLGLKSVTVVAAGVVLNRVAWVWPYVYVWHRGRLPVPLRWLVLTWVAFAGSAGAFALLG